MKKTIRIAIYVEGGLVQGVFTDCSEQSLPIEVAIYDYDTEGADSDEIMVQADGREYVGSIANATCSPDIIEAVFNATEYEDKTMKPTKKERMYQRIQKHGEQLNAIFKTSYEPVELCKKLRRYETEQTRNNVQYCNGGIGEYTFDLRKQRMKKLVSKLLGDTVPIMINGDPRGYALKIDEQIVRDRNLDILTDWGGYGILAPDLTED